MGLLDFLWQGQGGGLLPQQPPQPQATPPGQPTFMSGLVDYFRNNPATISALAAGIGGAPSMRQGIAQAAGGMPQAMGMDQQRQGQQALGQYFKDPSNAQGLTPGQMQLLSKYPALAEKYALQSMIPGQTDDLKEYSFYSQQEKAAGRQPDSFKVWQTTIKGATGAQESYYGTPSQVVDKDRNVIALMIYSNRGNVKYLSLDGQTQLSGPPAGAAGVIPSATPGTTDNPQVAGALPGGQFPPGSEIAPRGSVKLGDTGTSLIPVSPTGGRVGAPIPKDVTGAAAQQAAGTVSGTAAANLPTAINNAQRLIDNIDRLSNDPALDSVIGRFMPLGVPKPAMPTMNDDMARARAEVDQVLGGTFLQAYNDLRGAGAITEREGAAAQSAYNKLRNTDMGAQDYRQALQEFKVQVQKLMEIARQRAALGGVAPQPSAAPASSGPTFTLPDGTVVRQVN